MAKKHTASDFGIEATAEHRFEAKLILAEDVTVVFLMMGLLEPVKFHSEDLARDLRMTFGEVLKRWVPDEVADKAAGHILGEDDVANLVVPDEAEVENVAILLASADQYPEEFAAAAAGLEEDES